MNKTELEGKWAQMKGMVKEKWGKLTNDDLTVIEGKKDRLVGKLRAQYGYTAEQAEKEYDTFVNSCGCGAKESSDKRPSDRSASL